MAMGLAASFGSMFMPGLFGRGMQAAQQAQAAQAAQQAAQNQQKVVEAMNTMIPILPQMMRGQRLFELAQAKKCAFAQGVQPPR
jgi:hypothetical protein